MRLEIEDVTGPKDVPRTNLEMYYYLLTFNGVQFVPHHLFCNERRHLAEGLSANIRRLED